MLGAELAEPSLGLLPPPATICDRFALTQGSGRDSGAGVATVWKVPVGGLEIGQVDQISLTPYRSLHGDEVRERANRSLHAIDAASLGARQKVGKGHRSGSLGEKIEFAVRGGQVDRPISGDPTLGDRRAVGSGGAPFVDQLPDPLNIFGVGIEHRIDVSRSPDDSVPN
jgi:hypothetical protein